AERRDGGHRAPRVVGLEWLDPPFAVGHWVPEQIRRAGGWDVLGADGAKAHETTWDAVAEVDPAMIFLMPCGFHLAETVQDWARAPKPPWLSDLPAARRGAIVALDGSSYFSRPGPRVIDGIELLAEIMDPDGFVDIAPPGGWTPVPVG
ncbi:MAG: cobalamin-binding protein, partial [Candidatus Limnocylindrales bacterium]